MKRDEKKRNLATPTRRAVRKNEVHKVEPTKIPSSKLTRGHEQEARKLRQPQDAELDQGGRTSQTHKEDLHLQFMLRSPRVFKGGEPERDTPPSCVPAPLMIEYKTMKVGRHPKTPPRD